MSELNIQNINIQALTKLYLNLLQNFLNTYIMFKDIHTRLVLDYRDALNFFVIGISIKKKQINRIIISHKNLLLKKLKVNMHKMDVRTL